MSQFLGAVALEATLPEFLSESSLNLRRITGITVVMVLIWYC